MDDDKTNNFEPIGEFLTEVTVGEFLQNYGNLRLNGYEIATDYIVLELEDRFERSTDFDSLKKELTEFIAGRKKFLEFIKSRFNSKGEYVFDL